MQLNNGCTKLITNEMYDLRKQEILKKHVGRCFKKEDADTWCIIIDIPHECHTKTGIDFNEHQLPAMFLYFNSLDHDTKGRAVLDYDTFFTGDLPEVEHPLKSMQKVFWKEVSSELFWKVYDRFCNTIRDQVPKFRIDPIPVILNQNLTLIIQSKQFCLSRNFA